MDLNLVGLVFLSICGCVASIRKFHMEDYCDQTISMITSSFKQAAIKLDAREKFYHGLFSRYPDNECEIGLEAWYTWDSIGFYFDDLDLPCNYGYLVFYDGEDVIDGLNKVCDDYYHGGQYVATSRTLKIKYVGQFSRKNVMNLIVTAFHEGHCESYEYQCDSGRCIDEDLSCSKYKSCGDGDNCRISAGAVAGIIVGCLVGVGIVVIVIVIVCCCRRRKLPTTTAAASGPVIFMAQAVPAVSLNSSQQPPPYSVASNQPTPSGYYGNQVYLTPQPEKIVPSPTV